MTFAKMDKLRNTRKDFRLIVLSHSTRDGKMKQDREFFMGAYMFKYYQYRGFNHFLVKRISKISAFLKVHHELQWKWNYLCLPIKRGCFHVWF